MCCNSKPLFHTLRQGTLSYYYCRGTEATNMSLSFQSSTIIFLSKSHLLYLLTFEKHVYTFFGGEKKKDIM